MCVNLPPITIWGLGFAPYLDPGVGPQNVLLTFAVKDIEIPVKL